MPDCGETHAVSLDSQWLSSFSSLPLSVLEMALGEKLEKHRTCQSFLELGFLVF